ncbi:MAG: ribonuclease HII [Candidatus Cloacimonetes bacterium]|nr:ribonuclease HII [Candidatus Cloacimonadota bacterium]
MNIFEKQKLDFGNFKLIAGVDEAGRGPLAGPLVVSSVILKQDSYHEILNDSKKLTEKKREILYEWVITNAVDFFIKVISVEDIDRMNILQATLYGMKICVESLKIKPDIALIDGNKTPVAMTIPCQSIVKGDSLYSAISAASILSKVTRDQIMFELDRKYPQYAFKQHKGYPTQKHIELVLKYGMCPEHRKTYSIKNK